MATSILVLCFGKPLYDLMRFAAQNDLYSYILLIPVVSIYLVWSQRKQWPLPVQPAGKLAALFFGSGLVALAGYGWAVHSALLAKADYLALTTLAFVLCFTGICCQWLGRERVRALAFPIGLLIFMIPFPELMRQGIERLLQHGSAAVAAGMFWLSGLPVYQDGLLFRLPGINLEVATECSGIHSSLVLLITSLIAGYLFLRTPWKRATLALAVFPLAVLRNGFRVFVIGQLCVHGGSEMINSPIHRHGGPLFFILSLLPLLLLLLLLRKSERTLPKLSPSTPQT